MIEDIFLVVFIYLLFVSKIRSLECYLHVQMYSFVMRVMTNMKNNNNVLVDTSELFEDFVATEFYWLHALADSN